MQKGDSFKFRVPEPVKYKLYLLEPISCQHISNNKYSVWGKTDAKNIACKNAHYLALKWDEGKEPTELESSPSRCG